jgi:hypothetical protein
MVRTDIAPRLFSGDRGFVATSFVVEVLRRNPFGFGGIFNDKICRLDLREVSVALSELEICYSCDETRVLGVEGDGCADKRRLP